MLAPLDIALVRVDNRLVHGQILEAWVPFLHASCIIVANDEVASDVFRETVIRMAVPREIEVIVSTVGELAEKVPFCQCNGPKTILLVDSIQDARTIFTQGFHFRKLNIGNVCHEDCRICCTPSVTFNDEDIRDIDTLRQEGVAIELRRVPREKPVDYIEIMKKNQG